MLQKNCSKLDKYSVFLETVVTCSVICGWMKLCVNCIVLHLKRKIFQILYETFLPMLGLDVQHLSAYCIININLHYHILLNASVFVSSSKYYGLYDSPVEQCILWCWYIVESKTFCFAIYNTLPVTEVTKINCYQNWNL